MSIASALLANGFSGTRESALRIKAALAKAGFWTVQDLDCATDWWKSEDTKSLEPHEVGAIDALVARATEQGLVAQEAPRKRRRELACPLKALRRRA